MALSQFLNSSLLSLFHFVKKIMEKAHTHVDTLGAYSLATLRALLPGLVQPIEIDGAGLLKQAYEGARYADGIQVRENAMEGAT